MLLQQARAKAIQESKRHGCVQHVNATIKRSSIATPFVVYIVDFQGFTVGDWKDGTTVESYENGNLKD